MKIENFVAQTDGCGSKVNKRMPFYHRITAFYMADDQLYRSHVIKFAHRKTLSGIESIQKRCENKLDKIVVMLLVRFLILFFIF